MATRIRIRKTTQQKTVPGIHAILLTYDTERERFASRSERNKFYRGLYGFEQTVEQNNKVYHYEKEGVLDAVPHAKIADATFIIPATEASPVKQYFKTWAGKVNYHTYSIHLTKTEWDKLMRTQSR